MGPIGISSENWAFLKRVLLCSLVFHLVAAFFSVGFHHFDEHFQVYEFLAFKLGLGAESELAWEYRYQMRPWLQPAILYGLTKTLMMFGIDSPPHWAFFYRLLSALFGWCSICVLSVTAKNWFSRESHWKLAVVVLGFAWFLPYLNCRVSSEGWGGTFFILGLCCLTIFRERNLGLAFAGFLLGLAFEFRYQVGVIVGTTLLWMLWKEGMRKFTFAFGGMLIAILIGSLADVWGYSQWTFAPWHYFNWNLLQGKAASFGVTPWWWYVQSVYVKIAPPFSVVVILGTVAFWLLYPTHVLTWATLPFFVVHSLIGHKEDRFLFPIAALCLVTTVISLVRIEAFSWTRWLKSKPVLYSLAVINGALLLVSIAKPADLRTSLMSYLYKQAGDPVTLYVKGRNPYENAHLPYNFYKFPGLQVQAFRGSTDFTTALEGSDEQLWFLNDRFAFPDPLSDIKENCHLEYSSVPQWMTKLNVNNWVERTPILSLYRCRGLASK